MEEVKDDGGDGDATLRMVMMMMVMLVMVKTVVKGDRNGSS